MAVDDEISLDKCSLTHIVPGEYSWFTVDLENIYRVTKVCLLNTRTGKTNLFLNNFFFSLFIHI